MSDGAVPGDALPADDAVRADDAVAADASTPDEPTRYDTIVAGAGIAGLTIAHDLAARGYRVLVLEAADRIGGTAAKLALTLGTPGESAFALDAGAESFAVRGGTVAELIGELSMADDIVDPNPAGAWLVLPAGAGAARAVPLPKNTLLGIPSTPLAQDVIDALGWGGALRAHLDRLMPVLRIGTDDALGPLVRRRMGQKVLDRLVAPLAGGVYSADPELLDLAVVAPGLNGGMTRTGSLSGGVAYVLEERAAAAKADGRDPAVSRPGSAVQGLRGGIHRIAERLAERATAHHALLRTGERVQAATPTDSGWLVTTDAGSHAASSLVVALPEADAQRLLASLSLSGLDTPDSVGLLDQQDRSSSSGHRPRIEAQPARALELITLVFPAGAIEGDPRGTGVLVAADAKKVRAKAMTHATAKWSWLREAAGGREVVRLSYGSTDAGPATEGLDDAAATALALEDASAIFGVALPQPIASARVRWQQGQPSSIIGARERQQLLRDAAAAHDNLFVVGAAVAGTGLAQVIPDARKTALEIRRERFAVQGTPWTADIAPEETLGDDAASDDVSAIDDTAADTDKQGDS